MREIRLDSKLCEKYLKVLDDYKINMSQQCDIFFYKENKKVSNAVLIHIYKNIALDML